MNAYGLYAAAVISIIFRVLKLDARFSFNTGDVKTKQSELVAACFVLVEALRLLWLLNSNHLVFRVSCFDSLDNVSSPT